jgi:hypothetical protein
VTAYSPSVLHERDILVVISPTLKYFCNGPYSCATLAA